MKSVFIPSGVLAPQIVDKDKKELLNMVKDKNGLCEFATRRIGGRKFFVVIGDSSAYEWDTISTVYLSKRHGKTIWAVDTMGPALIFSVQYTEDGPEIGELSDDDISTVFANVECIDGEYVCRTE